MQANKLVWLACLATLPGCGEEAAQLVSMKMELNAMKLELEHLRMQTEELDPRVRSAEQMAMQSIDEREAPLALDCVGHVPGVLVTRVAPLTVVCEELAQGAEGDRIRLKLGNPTSGRLDGVHLTVYAGAGAAHGRSDARLSVQAPGSLPPGAWKTVEVDLPPLDRAAVPDLAVRAQVEAIVLAQR